jgi:hypothetical protein
VTVLILLALFVLAPLVALAAALICAALVVVLIVAVFYAAGRLLVALVIGVRVETTSPHRSTYQRKAYK